MPFVASFCYCSFTTKISIENSKPILNVLYSPVPGLHNAFNYLVLVINLSKTLDIYVEDHRDF